MSQEVPQCFGPQAFCVSSVVPAVASPFSPTPNSFTGFSASTPSAAFVLSPFSSSSLSSSFSSPSLSSSASFLLSPFSTLPSSSSSSYATAALTAPTAPAHHTCSGPLEAPAMAYGHDALLHFAASTASCAASPAPALATPAATLAVHPAASSSSSPRVKRARRDAASAAEHDTDSLSGSCPAATTTTSSATSSKNRGRSSSAGKKEVKLSIGVKIKVPHHFHVAMANGSVIEVPAEVICAEDDEPLKDFILRHRVVREEDQMALKKLRRKVLSRGYSKKSRLESEKSQEKIRQSVEESEGKMREERLRQIVADCLHKRFGEAVDAQRLAQVLDLMMQDTAGARQELYAMMS